MNKLITVAIAACMAVLTGCKTTPTVEKSELIGTAAGTTTAYILNNQVKVADNVRANIIAITTEVDKCVPDTNSTFTATWTPIAKKYLDDFVDSKGNKLPEDVKTVVLKDFAYITKMLDWYVEKKNLKQYQECVDAFVHAFTGSFLTDFKPSNNTVSASAKEPAKPDDDALEYFKSIK